MKNVFRDALIGICIFIVGVSVGLGLYPVFNGPNVTVNVPANFKPMQQITNSLSINNERAIIWYSVYKAAMDSGYHGGAEYDANEALKSIYK